MPTISTNCRPHQTPAQFRFPFEKSDLAIVSRHGHPTWAQRAMRLGRLSSRHRQLAPAQRLRASTQCQPSRRKPASVANNGPSERLSTGINAADHPNAPALPRTYLESVRRLQAGLHSFLSMRRIEARRKNARAFRLRFSQSLASLRQRLSQAMVRSTIQRLGKITNPLI